MSNDNTTPSPFDPSVVNGVVKLTDDMVLPFMLEKTGINGRIVRMGNTINTILSRHEDVPYPAKMLLGQFLTLGAALATALKFDGVFTLQAKGDGPVSMMVADVTSNGDVRGYVKVNKELPDEEDCLRSPVLFLLEKGYLAFTVDQGKDMERYQGIVEIRGKTLDEAVSHYFAQSDQFNSQVHLAADKGPDGKWRSSCIVLQKLPEEGGVSKHVTDDAQEDWMRAVTLMKSATNDELISENLSAEDLLFRLFHEDGVRVFDPKPLDIGCRCSRDKITGVLMQLSDDDLDHAFVDDKISVNCEFCNTAFDFTRDDVAALKAAR
ncbi:MAG: Hsp33 family molecular chaperone HslO [Alphaproteobacteria bacterium]|nr:Hsp33 family molecular chaperone HslO [Alphaproteobacteria bacterium]